jgi:DNA-binding GntR family transcriptional regulator
VFRALRILRDEGLLEFRRGRGVSVSGSASARESAVRERLRELVDFARFHGHRKEDLAEMLEARGAGGRPAGPGWAERWRRRRAVGVAVAPSGGSGAGDLVGRWRSS